MGIISNERWKGRIKAGFKTIMHRYGLDYTGEPIPEHDLATLIIALSSRLPESQQPTCYALAEKAAEVMTGDGITNPSKYNALSPEEMNGAREGDYLFSKYAYNFIDKLLTDYDYLPMIEAEEAARKKRTIRTWATIGAVSAAIIIFVTVYNLPYFAEKRLYDKIEKECATEGPYNYMKDVEEYLAKYPDGTHKEDVMIAVMKGNQRNNATIRTLDAVADYLKAYPNGKEAAYANQLYNSIWDAEIKKYDEEAGKNASPEAREYVHSMLEYMKGHHERTIYVVSQSDIKLKEYSEYSSDLRSFMEQSFTGERFTLPKDIHTIKDKIGKEEINKWSDALRRSLQEKFNKVLTFNLIEFKSPEEDEITEYNKHPYVKLTYGVNTQETSYGRGIVLPDIWTYEETENGYVVDGGLYLGISLDYKADFTLPGNGKSYIVTASGNPGNENIKDVDPSMFYSRMCERCNKTFIEKIEQDLGINKLSE